MTPLQEALWNQLLIVLAYLFGRYQNQCIQFVKNLCLRPWFRLLGWRKVKSPWTLYEKKYPSGLIYRATDFKGCHDADERYYKTKDPAPKL